jgi:hypothetical protein
MSFFFDAHFHPTLKKLFANPETSISSSELPVFSPWRTITKHDLLEGFNAISLARCLIKPFVESTLVSQSSLVQVTNSKYKLAVAVLFCPDKGLLDLVFNNREFKKIVDRGRFGDFLVSKQFIKLMQANDAFSTIKRDLELIEREESGKKVIKLRIPDFNPSTDDALALVFSIEGLHSLRSRLDDQNMDMIIPDILRNLDSLLEANRIVTINITHIDNGNTIFANQAYAVDGFREAGLNETNLRPVGLGLTGAGRKIALALYKREILPDIKHMSWLARRQLYEFRKMNDIKAPIVCSHAGFTGCWFNNTAFNESISDFILQLGVSRKVNKKPQHRVILAKPNPYLTGSGVGFNASSINLFNEDIAEILESQGLIGISLDQRILGFSEFQDGDNFTSQNVVTLEDNGELKVLSDSEFISDNEFVVLPEYNRISQRIDKVRSGVITFDRKTGNSTDIKNFFQPRHFFLQIVHAMQVARTIGSLINVSKGEEKAIQMLTQTLCIGSDFDGLVDGLDCCKDATEISSLKHRFVEDFEDFLDDLGFSFPEGLSAMNVANRIFYENGRDFVLRRLAAINSLQDKAKPL